MGTQRLKQFFCLLLAALTLAASSHHSLCDARVINCPPCQTSDSGDQDDCPICAVSRTLAKTSVTPARFVMPMVALLALPDVFTALLLSKPVRTEPVLMHLDFISPQKRHYLRDLVQSIPIRGPSLTA
jgi:hypothetical protein